MSDDPVTPVAARYAATRLALVEALRNIPLTGRMTQEALIKMADAITAQLPVVGEAAIRASERERIAADLERRGDDLGKRASDGDLDAAVAFFDAARIIREQP